MPRKTQAERFWEKVEVKEDHECWPWTAYVDKSKGYGQFGVGGRDGGLESAHRMAYRLAVGPIGEGMHIDHTCHNGSGCPGGKECPHRRCCNPAHLEQVTQEVNKARGEAGAYNAAKTACPQGHSYTPENILWRRGGRDRVCRLCNRNHQAKYREKMRARRIHVR
ncbi:HNH endonuclease [Arthrobacter phage Chocolat]|uniref:HNH endonuclease n=11 Tax=Klausavirus princesstrina TaxID=1984784 RepID=A0A286N4B2_9CAUD|nr:HNH endonuclease [Arthrobacter phage PrincessTrina]AOZ64651.1 HNH endonuclease [Arthrobacter phage Chubster]AOZ64763.1 HNH endonuclease [Arthrobacter phage Chocolat]APC44783.1 HNH endonuclease [Arthrobacter phage EdgarPoe]APC44893.1 HNH endonuclease [Arthrobacter phage HumptyDumpty]ASX98884.1 HNH endonuclease [Arthrobacter phage Kabreeze]ASX99108.1 HNH endonuclease [Arthrobacter phage Scavito]ASX99219.1 HNH endonuclease [Arthrobacter phage Tophat]QBP30472.1 HNH endonuclease [Arthrobacter